MPTKGWTKGFCINGHIDPPRNSSQACIQCANERRRGTGRGREYARQRYVDNPDYWRQDHIVKNKRAYYKQYCIDNPDIVAEYSSKYRKLHTAQYAEYAAVRRARKLNQFIEYVSRAIVWERNDGICGICSEAVDPTNWHLDHIQPLSKGGLHSYENTQVSHPLCNIKKGNR